MNGSKQRTYVAGEALSAGDVVYLSTTNKLMQVDTTYANIVKVVGVAATDAASGADVAIKKGRVYLPASGTVNAGSKIRLGSGIAGVVEALGSLLRAIYHAPTPALHTVFLLILSTMQRISTQYSHRLLLVVLPRGPGRHHKPYVV